MKAILIHGMGRTPISMLILKKRLAVRGLRPTLFGYSATFEKFARCVQRLVIQIHKTTADEPYALIGHSLGTVIIRGTLPHLASNLPQACFFLAPPSQVCRAAAYFSPRIVFRMLMGEMGQFLADETFMSSLPVPQMYTKIYAGTGCPRISWFPLSDEKNDGILTLSEARGVLTCPLVEVPSLHTWIMNSQLVAEDIANSIYPLL